MGSARALAAGLVGTAAMALLMSAAPRFGLPPMSISALLAAALGASAAIGWAVQFVFGMALGLVYATLFARRLSGAPAMRGALFGLGSWAAEQLVFFPLIGVPLFGGSTNLSLGSLAGHLVYGIVLGLTCGDPARGSSGPDIRKSHQR